ncbi:alanine racemase [Ferrimicrobium sp.]|uniref:alanine racemase n=1 Tax=Ferrimicrobium sp. TaxID=2926050 RepID=UPI002624B9C8|nr:alanine racemase [Ferrimicrobium sp.]
MPLYDDVGARLSQVREVIRRHGGSDAINIVAVTKTHPVDAVASALSAGLTDIGENYAEELAAKAAQAERLGLKPRWHYLGTIQRRHLKLVCQYASVIETISRASELETLATLEYRGDLLVQVAPPGNPQGRNGAEPDEVRSLVALGRNLNLQVIGLMGMALPGSQEQSRLYFQSVHLLGESLGLREYSMGMSADYQVAVAQGATMVRLGSVLFGARGQERATIER